MMKAWEKGSPLVALVQGEGALDRRIKSNQLRTKKAVAKAPNAIGCIDERHAPGIKAYESGKTCLGCAGAGILIPGVREFLTEGAPPSPEMTEFIQTLKERKIKFVYPHEGCGAAGAFAESVGEPKRAPFYAQLWAMKLADLIGAEQKTMTRISPEGFHDARAVYIDLTPDGRFNPDEAARDFPKGFHVSAHVMGLAQAEIEMNVAIDIALGAHGFGEFFTPATPLIVFVISYGESEDGDAFLKGSSHDGRVVYRKVTALKKPRS